MLFASRPLHRRLTFFHRSAPFPFNSFSVSRGRSGNSSLSSATLHSHTANRTRCRVVVSVGVCNGIGIGKSRTAQRKWLGCAHSSTLPHSHSCVCGRAFYIVEKYHSRVRSSLLRFTISFCCRCAVLCVCELATNGKLLTLSKFTNQKIVRRMQRPSTGAWVSCTKLRRRRIKFRFLNLERISVYCRHCPFCCFLFASRLWAAKCSECCLAVWIIHKTNTNDVD